MRFSLFARLAFLFGLGPGLAASGQASIRPSPPHRMQSYQVEKFPLSASPCAAKGYPMTIHIGAFVRSDERTFPVPSGHVLRGEWGKSSIGWAVGDENQPAPASLEILYFSYTEDTFYEGRFTMPQQRIHTLLKTGFWDTTTKKHATYDELTVCVLPKGMVCIWLTGVGQKVFIGRFQGSVSDADFKQFYPKTDRAELYRSQRAELPPEVQQQIKSGTISTQPWGSYLKTYSWQVGLPKLLTLYDCKISYFNAEVISYPNTPDLAPYLKALLTPTARATPCWLRLYVRDEAGHQHLLRTKAFDEAETLAAFRTLHQQSPNSALTLRVETDKYVKKASFVLTDGVRTIPLTKTAVEVLAQD